ncbi:MAG TPA: MFS transporter, partial [Anaerolineales bacterium]|nr:MFS transporter [Anaerolineales bacterium]
GRVWASLWVDVKAGLQFVAHNPLVRAVILGMATVQLGLGAANVLWVPFLTDIYQAGPGVIGLVDSVHGVGMGLGALAVGWLAARASQARIAALGFMFTGLSLSLVGVAPNMTFIFIMMLIHGAAFTPARAAVFTLLQQGSPGKTRGRVFGALGLFTRSAGSVSTVLAAGAASLLGIRTVYIVCGGFIILAGFIFLRVRKVQLPSAVPVE